MAKFVPKLKFNPNSKIKGRAKNPNKNSKDKNDSDDTSVVNAETIEMVEDLNAEGLEKHLANSDLDGIDVTEKKLKGDLEELNRKNDPSIKSDIFGAFAYIFQDVSEAFKKQVNSYKRVETLEKLDVLDKLREEYKANKELSKESVNKAGFVDKAGDFLVSASKDIAKVVALDLLKDNMPESAIFSSVLEKSKELLTTSKNMNIKDILAGNIISTIEGEKETTSDKNDNNDKEEEKDYDRQRDTLKDTDRLRATAPKLRAR